MFRTITMTIATLFALNAQAGPYPAEDTCNLTLLNFSPLYEDDAAYLAKILDCTPEKDGACSVEVRGAEESTGGPGLVGLYRPGRVEITSIEPIHPDEAATSIGAMFLEEFEVSEDCCLMLWGTDDDGKEAEVFVSNGGSACVSS